MRTSGREGRIAFYGRVHRCAAKWDTWGEARASGRGGGRGARGGAWRHQPVLKCECELCSMCMLQHRCVGAVWCSALPSAYNRRFSLSTLALALSLFCPPPSFLPPCRARALSLIPIADGSSTSRPARNNAHPTRLHILLVRVPRLIARSASRAQLLFESLCFAIFRCNTEHVAKRINTESMAQKDQDIRERNTYKLQREDAFSSYRLHP